MAAQTKNVESTIRKKLDSLPKSQATHCVYKVPEHIRKVNRECYQPSLVSIGPIYYSFKTSSLKSSQELKLRHLECFLDYGTLMYGERAYSLSQYIDTLKPWELAARSYYEEKITLSSDEFVEMMMIDAAFIVYFIMVHNKSRHFSSLTNPMEKKTAWMVKVEQDLFLEDNQLPFFVLNKLYEAFGQADTHTLISFKELTCNFVGDTYIPVKETAITVGRCKIIETSYIKHLVDFLRICGLPPKRTSHDQNPQKDEMRIYIPPNSPQNQNPKNNLVRLCCLPLKCSRNQTLKNNEESQFPLSVKDLKAAGIKFTATDSKNLLDIRYTDGVLQIPTLTIQDTTEAILRSIIFFEQCHHFYDSYFTDYVFFLDNLINTPEDVRILVQHGIIKHWLGSDDEVTIIMNRMTTNIMIYTPNFYYSEISRRLNAHATTRWNKWKAILRRNYFNHPWSTISVVYLILLLVLTLLQVYTGFKG